MKIAAIRIRTAVKAGNHIREGLKHLNLLKKNNCVVLEDTPSARGQLRKVQGFITWGAVTDETLKAMEKRKKGKFYCLHPPRKGFGRKGVKLPFKLGGALGNRKDKINDLIMRML